MSASQQVQLTSLLVACVVTLPATGQSIRNYDVNFTTNNIVADGVISPGEWDGAAPAAGDWRELRQPFSDVDSDNNRFSVLYDTHNLYILYETDYDSGFLNDFGGNPNILFGEENLSVYIDPNRDGDLNTDRDGNPVSPNEAATNGDRPDGYQISFNQYRGTHISTHTDRDGIGFFTEAHVNSPFGDQANWNRGGDALGGAALAGSDIVVAQNNQNRQLVPALSAPTAFGIAEIIIPFVDLDADALITAPPRRGRNSLIETGLDATDGGTRPGPVAGEVWGFNMAMITRDQNSNFLPMWNWHNANSFPIWPHGTITFQPIPEPASLAMALVGVLAIVVPCRRRVG